MGQINVSKISEHNNKDIDLIKLDNGNVSISFLNYGALIYEIIVPDKDGVKENIVCSYENVEDYIDSSTYFGMICGRTSGRIEDGIFNLDGKEYNVSINNGGNNLHGGFKGFGYKVWEYTTFKDGENLGVKFHCKSPHLEEGYPGNVEVEIIYTLIDKSITIEFSGTTDQKTLLNLTNHSYFNLSGDYKRLVTEQKLYIDADCFIRLKNNMIGIDNINVINTPMDFKIPKLIGKDIESPYLQDHNTSGYDHPWVLNESEFNKPKVIFEDELCGRKMEIFTTYPCLVVYSYNYADGELLKGNVRAKKYHGICFETQYEPNGINNKDFNSAILSKDEKYYEKTILKFSVNK